MPLTAQEVFDKALHGLRAQKQRSVRRAYGLCAYRGGTNGELKCGIGFCIPDEVYTPRMDSNDGADDITIGGLVRSNAKLMKLFEGIDRNFLTEVQDAHDNFMPPRFDSAVDMSAWEQAMADIAKQYGLNYTAPV